jgi:excisionase family DNA binding protein
MIDDRGSTGNSPEVKRLQYTVKDAALMLSVNPQTVYRLIERGELERRFVGTGQRNYRIPAASLERYLRRQTARTRHHDFGS